MPLSTITLLNRSSHSVPEREWARLNHLVKRSSNDFMNSLKSCIRRVYRLRISSTLRAASCLAIAFS